MKTTPESRRSTGPSDDEARTRMASIAPPSEAINPLPSRFTIVCLFWAVILLAIPYWWKTTTIERLSLPTKEVQAWVDRAPCYLRPKLSFAFQSTGSKDPKVEEAIHSTMSKLSATDGAECIDLDWAADLTSATYRVLLTDDDEILKRRLPPRTVAVSTKQDLPQKLFGNSSALLGLRTPPASMAKFSPRYKLVFSLLNEDSSSGDALLSWEAHSLLQRHIRPLLAALKPLHNFTIDTQIQYFAPLAIQVGHAEEGTLIEEDDLRAFINNADWNLPTSLTLDPILHFILYVPKKEHRPMRIKTNDDRPAPNGFITPQRGGVAIFNPPPPSPDSEPTPPNLAPAFRLFESQLRKLLGVPPTMPGPSFVDDWQIDALVRERLAEATKDSVETLQAIVKLIEDIPNMRVGKDVQKGVKEALRQLKLAESALPGSPDRALSHAALASSLASKAYFDPSMLALLYFPDEHKYAIYTPLFGPVAVPLVIALAKEWKDRRKRRKEAAAAGRTAALKGSASKSGNGVEGGAMELGKAKAE